MFEYSTLPAERLHLHERRFSHVETVRSLHIVGLVPHLHVSAFLRLQQHVQHLQKIISEQPRALCIRKTHNHQTWQHSLMCHKSRELLERLRTVTETMVPQQYTADIQLSSRPARWYVKLCRCYQQLRCQVVLCDIVTAVHNNSPLQYLQ